MDSELAEAGLQTDDPEAAVRGLKPEVAARAREVETARRLPADLAGKMAEAGLFRLYLPRSLGGAEASLTRSDLAPRLVTPRQSTYRDPGLTLRRRCLS